MRLSLGFVAVFGVAALALPVPFAASPPTDVTSQDLAHFEADANSNLPTDASPTDTKPSTSVNKRFGWLIKKSLSDYTIADLEVDLANRRVADVWPESWFLKRDDEAAPLAEHLTSLEKKDPEAFGWLIKRDPEPFGWLIKKDPEAFGWLIKKDPEAFGSLVKEDPEAFGWLIKRDPEAFGWLIKKDPEAFGWLIKHEPEAFGWLIKRDPEAFGWLIKREPKVFDHLSKRDPEGLGGLTKKDPQQFGWLIKRSAEAFGWLIKKDTAAANEERAAEAKQILRLPDHSFAASKKATEAGKTGV